MKTLPDMKKLSKFINSITTNVKPFFNKKKTQLENGNKCVPIKKTLNINVLNSPVKRHRVAGPCPGKLVI